MIIRAFQGGFTTRKFLYWVRSSIRFRFGGVIFLCTFAYIIREALLQYGSSFAFWLHFYFVHLVRKPGAGIEKIPFQSLNPRGIISELPPSPNVVKKLHDDESKYKLYVENEKYLRFKTFNEIDIARTRCLYAHPSRETNGVVEGEILRNEQNKIVESMKIMIAEFGVNKGIWKDINEAFKQSDESERKKTRESFKQILS